MFSGATAERECKNERLDKEKGKGYCYVGKYKTSREKGRFEDGYEV